MLLYKKLLLITFGTTLVIKQVAERHDTEPAICRWIYAMLDSRNISAIPSGETLRASAARGCPKGGVLSPLLWGEHKAEEYPLLGAAI
jgi:hypothetical protein